MNIYAIDDERLALKALTEAIEKAIPEATVHSFSLPSEMLAAIPTTPCDVAFMDINMPGITGLELAKQLKSVYPQVNIVFVTGYGEYAEEAISLRASGYVKKPVTADKIKEEMQALRHPIVAPKTEEKPLYIQCFGNFEVFAGGKQVIFKRAKAKELLAYLVNRKGANCTMGELAAVLWEDSDDTKSKQSQLRTLIADLKATLKDAGVPDAINKGRNAISLNLAVVSCDYYSYNESPMAYINQYRGEYMAQYSWAESTNATIMDIE